MPELPEVETVRRGLAPTLVDARIDDVIVREPRLRWPVAADFAERLRGRRIERVERRSKYLLLRLAGSDSLTLLAHLGMTGSFVARPIAAGENVPLRLHDHVDFRLDTNAGHYLLRYNDLVYGISAADVQRVARQYLRNDNYTLVVAGPGDEE